MLLYLSPEREGSPSKLYKVERRGESKLLSDLPAGVSVQRFLLSPDRQWVAYWDWVVDGQITLVMRPVDASSGAETRLALAQASNFDWVEWLPDSRRLLLSIDEPSDHSRSLLLASVGESDPVELIATEPGSLARLTYSVSADAGRLAVEAQYLGDSYASPATSADLFLLDLASDEVPLLLDAASADANAFDFAWSPTGAALLYQRQLDDTHQRIPRGPLILLSEDGSSRQLLDANTDRSARWLDSGQILTAAPLAFEVLNSAGEILASHTSTLVSPGTEAGAASVLQSPDGRWLAFLDWTGAEALEVYRYDMQTGETRIIGPASSIPVVFHGSAIAYYDESELHWSGDSQWLVWDRLADTPSPQQLYTHAVATGSTELIPANTRYFHNSSAPFNTEGDDPWLPRGNLLEYVVTPGSAYPTGADSTLTVYDLDAGRPWLVQPAPPVVSSATDSGKSVTVGPSGICERTWLQNDELLWHGCDENLYLSRIVEGGLAETRLLVRAVDPFFTLSGNRELVIVQPAGGVGNWWMYDFAAQRPVELQGTEGMSCCWGGLLQ